MKCYISVVCVLSALIAVTLAAPAVPEDRQISSLDAQGTDIQLPNSGSTEVEKPRTRRDISLLRQLCPDLFKVIDNVIQNVTSQVFRIVGGAVLRSGGFGGGGRSGSSSGSRVSVVLPTFPPDDDDEEDEDSNDVGDVRTSNRLGGDGDADSSSTTTTEAAGGNELSADSSSPSASASSDLFTSSPKENEVQDNSNVTPSASTTTEVASTKVEGTDATTVTTTTTMMTTTMSESANQAKRAVRRRVRAAEDDQQVAASGANGPNPADDLSNVETDDTDRNKRFLPFGGDHGGHGGGSGNFLFDLIRNTADRAARTVGTVYRMVAGTENLGFGVTATSTSTKTVAAASSPQTRDLQRTASSMESKLVAGSGATEEGDEKDAGIDAGGIAEVDVAPKHGDGEGIPGPITRLLVIANRGIANLVQDLILRLAQTSERIVNFKARLVTALI